MPAEALVVPAEELVEEPVAEPGLTEELKPVFGVSHYNLLNLRSIFYQIF